MSLTLYYHPLSSYCHKVLIALYERNIAFDKRLIDFSIDADREALLALWPVGKFPVIHDPARGQVVPESTVIIEHLDHHFAAPTSMIPADPQAAQEVRLWDRIFDNHVQGPLQDIVMDRIMGSQGDMSRARAKLTTVYRLIDERLATRTWVGGDTFSLADCAAAPALFYTSTLQAFAPESVHLAAYFERLVARPAVARVLVETRPYFHMYPFADQVPKRFL